MDRTLPGSLPLRGFAETRPAELPALEGLPAEPASAAQYRAALPVFKLQPPAAAAVAELALLERRLSRERASRKAAEQLLEQKSREIFRALTQARESEHRLQLALWASGEGIWEWSADAPIMRLERLDFGGTPLHWSGRAITDVMADVHIDDREAVARAWKLHLNGARPDLDIAFRLHHGGRFRWVRARGRVLRPESPAEALRVIGTVKDISAQREAEESLRMMAHAFAGTRDAMVVIDRHWRVLEANEALGALLAVPAAQALGHSLQEMIDLGDLVLEDLVGADTWSRERLVMREGAALPVDVSVTAVAAANERDTCYIVTLRDISERKRHHARLERLALNDTMTGLPNRSALEAELERALRDAAAAPTRAVLFLDLEGFRRVNDLYGHDQGDAVLRQVAQQLCSAVPRNASVYRWGGDQFAVLLGAGADEETASEAAVVIVRELSRPLAVRDQAISLGVHVGVVVAPRDGVVPSTLLRRVDTALDVARTGSGARVVFYSPAFEDRARRRARLTSLMRQDAERDGFRFAVQSKVDAQGRLTGGELLMRWSTDLYGAVSPAEFVPLAEQIGLIEVLGRQAMHAAARLAARLAPTHPALQIAVNLSPRQLSAPDIEAALLEACRRHGVPPRAIELEVTESALVHSFEVVRPLLGRLHDIGFGLALDDFGTGYSSLSYLRHLPFDKVKIDRSFVIDVESDARAVRLLSGIVGLCGTLGMGVVAEGVETHAQLQALQTMGVQEFQGYLFARPEFVQDWLERLGAQCPAARTDTAAIVD